MPFKIFNFLPKDEKFTHALSGLSSQANQSVRMLKAMLDAPTLDHPSALSANQNITQAKLEAKKFYESISENICLTFVTPFDREDIQRLSHVLYKIPKRVDKIKDRILAHDLKPHQGDFIRMINLMAREADIMEEVMVLVLAHKSLRVVAEKTAVLHELEDQGNTLLGELIKALFESPLEARELILRKDLYDTLESVTDAYRDAANVAMQVMLKHH